MSRSWVVVVCVALGVAACSSGNVTAPTTQTSLPGGDLAATEYLMIIGDWGSGTTSQEAVAQTMADYAEQHDVAAIVTTGDNFYSDDADTLIEPFSWTEEHEIPIVISWGNHDVETGSRIDVINETFQDPPRWATHEWGPVDIVILDSTQVDSPDQLDYLDDTLAAGDDPTIVVFHHPPYSCGSHGNTEEVIDQWVPQFDDDVFLVLSGHEHNYQRFESGNVTYVVTGGGGRSLTPLATCPTEQPQQVAAEEVYHFLLIELSDAVRITAIDLDGRVIDEFSVTIP